MAQRWRNSASASAILSISYTDQLDGLGPLTRLNRDPLVILAGFVVAFWVESRDLYDGGLAPAEIMRVQRRRMRAANRAKGYMRELGLTPTARMSMEVTQLPTAIDPADPARLLTP